MDDFINTGLKIVELYTNELTETELTSLTSLYNTEVLKSFKVPKTNLEKLLNFADLTTYLK